MAGLVCGIDEVGRGALAGPIVAVAALFRYVGAADWGPHHCPIEDIRDSKSYSGEAARRKAFSRILRYVDLLDFGIGQIEAEEINRVGIDRANMMAFEQAVIDLKITPTFLLIDGTRPLGCWAMDAQKNAPKGDSLWWQVSAASVLAKVIRDNLMHEHAKAFPQYLWDDNKGYGSEPHMDALRKYGATPLHRKQYIKNIIRQEAHQ